jgi:hypothetical protein
MKSQINVNLEFLQTSVYLIFILIIIPLTGTVSQNLVEFGIFSGSGTNQAEIRIKPNYVESGANYLTNAQFTVKWPVSSGITSIQPDSPVFPYLLTQQGQPSINNGFYYQVWATPGGFSVNWSAGQEIMIQSFTWNSHPCPYFEIAYDDYVHNVINGDYYIEINGNPNLTGPLYQAAITSLPGPAGEISGPDTVWAGTSQVVYHIAPVYQADAYQWSYSGTGVILSGSGDSILITFDQNATSGILTDQPLLRLLSL